MKTMGRVLAIDYGHKRIGLALSDPLGITAQGLKSISAPKQIALTQIQTICKERGVHKCIVGLPLNLKGEIGTQAQAVLGWIDLLKPMLSCPVETWDERLTSRQAQRLMVEQGLNWKEQKLKSDQISAILILQNYLDATRASHE